MCVLSTTRRGARAGYDRHLCILPCCLFDREASKHHSTGQGTVAARRWPHATTTDPTHTSRADDVIVWFQKALQRCANERDDHTIAR